jgi:hypothetical protein
MNPNILKEVEQQYKELFDEEHINHKYFSFNAERTTEDYA